MPATTTTPPPHLDAVISDIDGCLGPESHAPLNADALAAIARANRASTRAATLTPTLTLCSGRPQPYAEALARLLSIRIPVICEMGVWIYDPRDNRFLMDPAITPDHLAMVRAAQAWIERDLCANHGVIIQPGKSASISLWHPDTPRLMALAPTLQDRFAREGWPLRVSNTVAWINCDLTFVSKATGIDRLAAMMGYTRDRLAGIGDTLGDMAIRERVAFFACPRNADPRLAARADYVSPYDDVEGVLDILARLGVTPP
jgi:hydroxymethylpyrimidine pyrophosphatase-like HAD family hydrolase